MVLLILAVIWAIFLVPQLLRARAEKTPADSIGAFRAQLSVLERTTPPGHGRPAHRSAFARDMSRDLAALRRADAARRRRDVLVALLGAMTVTFVLGTLTPLRSLLTLHVVLDVLFFAYIGLLVRARTIAEERRTKVRYLDARPAAATAPPELLLLRHSGS